ncbi:putative type II secretion system protein F [Thalassoglobus neptunius]|uniref:Putative type II secretion system protein F n=1 Tax=Thalassoglobus neptunius TaxID=1938619 RepID=A0A5C5WGM8_9PLAN|nr:type II secretion system F family protein [Thalassoglobus neptunius]TWT49946.1 putative type II secretion system protein F [Thalassoglobus neptunius]
MEPIFLLLVIPGTALMMLRFNHQRTAGLDPETRERSRQLLGAVAILLAAYTGIMAYLALQELFKASLNFSSTSVVLVRGLIASLCGITAWKTWQISKFQLDFDEEGPNTDDSRSSNDTFLQVVERDQTETTATAFAILLVLLPLALPAILFAATIGLIPIVIFVFSSHPGRVRQNQLLWSLAVGVRNDLNLGVEVDELVIAMRPRRPILRSVATIATIFFCFPIGIPLFISARRYDRFLKRLENLAFDLHDGTPLHSALKVQRDLIPQEFLGAIETAESTGQLKTVLPQLAFEHSRMLERRSMGTPVISTMIYSWVVIMVTLMVNFFVMVFIVPKYKQIFEDFGIELPAATLQLTHVSDWLFQYWFLASPLLIAPFLIPLGILWMFNESSDRLPDWVINLIPRIEAPSLLKRFAYVIQQGAPMQPVLKSLADSSPSFPRARRYERMQQRLNSGEQIGEILQEERFLNVRESLALQNSEKIGHLQWAMSSIAQAIEQTRFNRMRLFAEIIRPLTIIILANFVAFFCVAMFLPLIKLLNDLS